MGWLEYGLIIVYLIILDKWVFKGEDNGQFNTFYKTSLCENAR